MANMFSPTKKSLEDSVKVTIQEIQSLDKAEDSKEILEIRTRLVQVIRELDQKHVFCTAREDCAKEQPH